MNNNDEQQYYDNFFSSMHDREMRRIEMMEQGEVLERLMNDKLFADDVIIEVGDE